MSQKSPPKVWVYPLAMRHVLSLSIEPFDIYLMERPINTPTTSLNGGRIIRFQVFRSYEAHIFSSIATSKPGWTIASTCEEVIDTEDKEAVKTWYEEDKKVREIYWWRGYSTEGLDAQVLRHGRGGLSTDSDISIKNIYIHQNRYFKYYSHVIRAPNV